MKKKKRWQEEMAKNEKKKEAMKRRHGKEWSSKNKRLAFKKEVKRNFFINLFPKLIFGMRNTVKSGKTSILVRNCYTLLRKPPFILNKLTNAQMHIFLLKVRYFEYFLNLWLNTSKYLAISSFLYNANALNIMSYLDTFKTS